jgi:hypothetical protein
MQKLYTTCAEAIRDCYWLEGYAVYAYWLDRDGCPAAVKPYDGIYTMFAEWGGYTIAQDEDSAWVTICKILGKPRGVNFK